MWAGLPHPADLDGYLVPAASALRRGRPSVRICRELGRERRRLPGHGMMTFTELASVASDPAVPFADRLRLAVAAYLAGFTGTSREHTESDLRCYLAWCAERGLDPA
jgi:hypothetical protein